MNRLNDIALYVTDKISSSNIDLWQYVTTDSILQNKKGIQEAQNLPPVPVQLIEFKVGDVLVANIRPYLKKIWRADFCGGASSDVLVFRAKEEHDNNYLYACLAQDDFFDYVMQGTKGSKMPRGDKNHIMRFPIIPFSYYEEKNIGSLAYNICQKIQTLGLINRNLLAS